MSLLAYGFFYPLYSFPVPVTILLWWIWRTKDRSWVIPGFLFVILTGTGLFSAGKIFRTGRVVSVRESCIIVQNRLSNALIYTTESVPYDAEVSFSGTITLPEEEGRLYYFHTANWLKEEHISFAVKHAAVTVQKERFSIRALIQKRVSSVKNSTQKQLLQAYLLNIRTHDPIPYFFDNGFSLTALLVLIEKVLACLFSENRKNRIILSAGILLNVIYRFPMIGSYWLMNRIAGALHMDRTEKPGVLLSLLWLLYPSHCRSYLFLFLAATGFLPVDFRQKKWIRFFVAGVLQSITFKEANPLIILLFPYIRLMRGMLSCLAWLNLLVPQIPLLAWAVRLMEPLSVLSYAAIPGSCLGMGLPFYLLLCAAFRRNHFRIRKMCLLFYLFLLSGLFHPFAELSCVMNRDDLFVSYKEPLSKQAYLLYQSEGVGTCTGAYSKAKGIRFVIQPEKTDEPVKERYGKAVCLRSIHEDSSGEADVLLQLNGLRCYIVSEQSAEAVLPGIPVHLAVFTGGNPAWIIRQMTRIRPDYVLVKDPFADDSYSESVIRIRNEQWVSIISLPGFNLFLSGRGKIGIIKV